MRCASQTESTVIVTIKRLANDVSVGKRTREISGMRAHAPYAKLGTRSRPNASPRDSHIDVLRSCTHGEPIAAVANEREDRRR